MNDSATNLTSQRLAGGLKIRSAGAYRMTNRHASEHARRPTWTLELILSGVLEVQPGGGAWRALQHGSGILYAPDTSYRERVVFQGTMQPCHSLAIVFDCEDAGKVGLPENRSFRLIDDPSHRLLEVTEQAVHGWHTGTAGQLLAHGCLMQAIGMLLLAEPRGQVLAIASGQVGLPMLVQTAHRVMTEQLNRPLRVADLARAVKLSPSGFAHAYRRITGRSPMTTLRDMRIASVRRHLESTDMTLEQIAELTGFADAFHLSRTFKKVVGVSPKKYVQQMREM